MIKKYDVCVIFDASRNVVVEARSALEAVELAEDEVEGLQRLCNHCSGNLDTGDVIGSHVWLGDEQLLDTTRAGDLEVQLSVANIRIAELKYALKVMYESFRPYADGSPENRADALKNAEKVLKL